MEEFGKGITTFHRDQGNHWLPPAEIWCDDLDTCAEDALNPSSLEDCFASGRCPTSLAGQYTYSFFWAVIVTTGIGWVRHGRPRVRRLPHMYSIPRVDAGTCHFIPQTALERQEDA